MLTGIFIFGGTIIGFMVVILSYKGFLWFIENCGRVETQKCVDDYFVPIKYNNKQTKCINCGAMIINNVCEYCGGEN